MYYRKLLQLFLLFLPLLSFGQQRWEIVIGDTADNDYPKGIINTYDGGNIIYSYKNSNHFTTLYKTNINGALLWKKNYFDKNISLGIMPASMTNKNNISVIVGHLSSYAEILLLNDCYDKLWCRKYDGTINNFWSVGFSDALMLDSIILVSAFTQDNNGIWGVYLFGFDYDGNLLWDKPIASHLIDPLLAQPIPAFIKKAGDNIFIVGDCYYAYASNPDVFHWRSMFIKLDSLYNKEWFLPYGMPDHISGTGFGVIKLDGNKFRGYGRCRINDTLHSIFMDFDTYGNEIAHKIIPLEAISPDIRDDDLRALHVIDDTTYYITSKIGVNHYDNPLGEFVVDTGGNIVYYYQNHPEIIDGNLHPSVKTFAGKFVNQAVVQNSYRDILLYKLNSDLNQATLDTNTYVYDSLCNHSIVSDTIYLDDCDIVTAVPEFPTPSAYYTAKQKVELTAYPNPVSGNTVYFKLKYTKYHSNMQFTVYDISGRPMAKKPIATGQKEAQLSVNGFSPGLYVAVVSNGKKVLGKRVFAVE